MPDEHTETATTMTNMSALDVEQGYRAARDALDREEVAEKHRVNQECSARLTQPSRERTAVVSQLRREFDALKSRLKNDEIRDVAKAVREVRGRYASQLVAAQREYDQKKADAHVEVDAVLKAVNVEIKEKSIEIEARINEKRAALIKEREEALAEVRRREAAEKKAKAAAATAAPTEAAPAAAG